MPILNKFVLAPLRKLKNLPRVIIRFLQTGIKKYADTKPASLKDYITIGSYYVSKRLLLLVILISLFVAYGSIKYLPKLFYGKPSVIYQAVAEKDKFTGKAKVYSESNVLIYEGELAGGQYNGAGSLYNEQGIMVYQGQFEKGLMSGTGTLYFESGAVKYLSLIHISEPTRQAEISYAVFGL
jgi:hypothetical protein